MNKRKRSSDDSTPSKSKNQNQQRSGPPGPSRRRQGDERSVEVIDLDDSDDLVGTTGQGVRAGRAKTKSREHNVSPNVPDKKSRNDPTSSKRLKPASSHQTGMEVGVPIPADKNGFDAFKMPNVPVPRQRPAIAGPSRPMEVETEPDSLELEGQVRTTSTTTTAKMFRKAITDVMQDHLENIPKESSDTPIIELVNNLWSCLNDANGMYYIFSPKLYPSETNLDDSSSDSEIEEFTCWWLFGLTGMLFGSQLEDVPKVTKEITSLIRVLCHYISNGYPLVCDRITPQLLRIFKDLSAVSDETAQAKLRLNIQMSSNPNFTLNIKIKPENEYAIPYFVEATSPLFPRIFFFHVKLRHVLVELLLNVFPTVTPDCVKTLFTVFSCCPGMPSSTFLTNCKTVRLIQNVMESPSSPSMDIDRLRVLFGNYSFLGDGTYTYLLNTLGLSLLQTGMRDYLYSSNFLQICENEKNDVILNAYRALQNNVTCNDHLQIEILKFANLLSLTGIDIVLHPLLQKTVVKEIEDALNQSDVTSLQRNFVSDKDQRIQVKLISKVWKTICQRWIDALPLRLLDQTSTNNLRTNDLKIIRNGAALMKLVYNIQKDLDSKETTRKRFKYFDADEFARWTDFIYFQLENLSNFSPTQQRELYTNILETLIYRDGILCLNNVHINELNKVLIIAIWPLLRLANMNLVPKANRTLPEFVDSASSAIQRSSLCMAKAMKALTLNIFRPWCFFIEDILISAMSDKEILDDIFQVSELLDAVASISWPFKRIPLNTTIKFLCSVIEKNLWKIHSNVRTSLGKAIVAIPCICWYQLRDKRTPNPLPGPGGCCVCLGVPGNCLSQLDGIELPESVAKNISCLAAPLLLSKFLIVKLDLVEVITRFNNHRINVSPEMVLPFLEVSIRGKANLSDQIFTKIGELLSETGDLNQGCEIKLHAAQRIFKRIPVMVAELTQDKELWLMRMIKIFNGYLLLSQYPLGIAVFVELVKKMLLTLAQSNNNVVIAVLCQQAVDNYKEHCRCKPFELISRIRYDIAKEIIKIAVNTFYQPRHSDSELNDRKCSDFINGVRSFGHFRSVGQFKHYFYPVLLQQILPKLHLHMKYCFLLKSLALSAGETVQKVLQEWLMYCFPGLLLDHTNDNVSMCLKFLRNTYKVDALFVAKQTEQVIINETLCRLHDQEVKVNRCLPHLCKWDEASTNMLYETGTSSNKPTSRSDLQDLLSKRLLGFFLHLDTKLHSRVESVETKKNILISFTKLLVIMGKNKITPLRAKVYKTLNSMTDEGPEYFEVLYEAWKAFAANLDNAQLGSMSSQILAALLRLRDGNSTMRAQVDGLISHFISFKRELTQAHYHEFYFLLDHCEDQGVLKTIGNTIKTLKDKNWFEYFTVLVKGSSHENSQVQYLALQKLNDVLNNEPDSVQQIVLAKGQQHVSQVISTLLSGLCGHSDEKLRHVIVDCLGALGALDPVRFRDGDDHIGFGKRSGLVFSGVTTFCLLYLQELIQEFKAAKDTTTFDYCACLIQQVLQEFNVGQQRGCPIWEKLSAESKEQIAPLVTTKYSLETSSSIPKLACPIYLSPDGRTFDAWLLNWLTVLIDCVTDKEEAIYSLLNKSKHLLRRNPRIAAFIIPHVAVWAAFCGTPKQRLEIVIEMKTVLERWTILEKMKLKAKDTMPIRDSETEYGLGASDEDLSIENETVFHSRCTQVVFSVLDYYHRSYKFFKRKWGLVKASEKYSSSSSTASTQQSPAAMSEKNMGTIEEILKGISSSLISQVAFDCQSYTVALYHLEEELRKTNQLQPNLGYLQRIYVSLNDMDSVIGISTIRENDPSLCETVLENIAQGQTVTSVQNLERMAERDPSNLVVHSALAQAYFNLEEPSKAAVLLRATIDRRSEWELALQDSQLECLVRLKQWPELKTAVGKLEQPTAASGMEEICFSWNIAMSRTISKIESNELDDADQVVKKLKAKLVAPLVAASEELNPYKRAYFHVVQLHILTEIDDAIKLFRKHSARIQTTAIENRDVSSHLMNDIMGTITKWNRRLSNVSKARKVIDQILNVRKSLFEIMKKAFHGDCNVRNVLSAAISDCWLEIAKDASKCGNFIRADNSLLQAKQYMSSKVVIEEAKILSRKGDKESAISVLHKGITRYFPEKSSWIQKNSSNTITESKILCSKALLLLAKLCEEQKLLDVEEYIAKYKEAVDVYRESEKNFFILGSYHDRLWSNSERGNPQMQATVVRYYSQSLFYGCKYVHQSLPRLLSIWFDFASGIETGESYKQHQRFLDAIAGKPSSSEGLTITPTPTAANKYYCNGIFDNMNESIKQMNQNIPKYILMTAFSQLISRICHPNKATWEILRDMIVSIIVQHPHQALWMSIAVSKSVNKLRAYKCLGIYKKVEDTNPNLKTMIKDYTTLSSKLIDLSEKNIERGVNKASLSVYCKQLFKLVNDLPRLQVSIPFQIFLHPTLPHGKFDHKSHNAFPESTVMIQRIEDSIEVMSSLVRPKKITFVGDNGKFYGLMCKPKDDLRKDSKVMEVNNVVNWYLKQNTESSQRQLRVRTFSVVPLNEECGLLEWVPNLQGLRPIILSLFKEKNITTNVREIRNLIQLNDTLEVQKTKFIERLIKPHPPVFRDWFFNNFNNHQAWYAARMSFIRTAAVMSVVGYIMGLGDRHGENIMIDATTGELVHVDFNCLFNKGETFEWIERVPFRLTQNLIDAMGPLGYEGIFRRSCEITMNMFREHQSIFLSVLRPFVFDPLVEWDKVEKKGKGMVALVDNGETTSSQAVETMKHILNRLNGTARNLKKNINSELSVKAQVDHLIEEATSVQNLCRMYIGWAAYL